MKTKTVIGVLSIALSCVAHGFGNAHLVVKVVDSETGNPLSGLRVHGGFLNYSQGWGKAAKDNNDDGVTGSDGLCHLSGNSEAGESCCIVRGNNGYYNSGWYSVEYAERSMLKLGRWLPDNVVVTVRLDRVINPIPLYVKKSIGAYREKSRSYHRIFKKDRDLSETNNVPVVKDALLAYDMIKGDWLPPHGNGEVCDIQFLFNETVLGWKEGRGYDGVSMSKKYKMTMAISMSGEGNGLVEVPGSETSGIRLRTAPLEGYVNNLARWFGWFGGGDGEKTDCDNNRCYVFRIRTMYDDRGNIKSAYYGKVYGDFDMGDIDGVRFLYYLNPTPNGRNLEWDMQHNLCPNTKDIGEPRP